MLKRLIIKIIKLYQRTPISTHKNCKFIPSCSEYAIEALETYGLFKGLRLAIVRLLRCNPFNKGGLDPVPIKHD
ncbi:MAG: membrane protein insertion efficiency factor YidD [Erysipelotrichales bacterium]|nr:membrane protein insertion efficiency factor YidD [Erysipelotrichales bacterium]